MKILQIGMGNNPGGVEAFVMNYYKELVTRGIEFDFISMYGKIAYEEEIKNLGGNVYYVPNVKKNYIGYRRQVLEIMKKGGYDAVHVNMLSAANLEPLILAKKAGIKRIIAHSHNASAPGVLRNIMDKMNRPRIQKYATCLAACSEKAGRWLFGEKAFEEGKVQLLQNAIHVDHYLYDEMTRKEIREKYGWQKRFVVGHVGRFDLQKNHMKLLEIFAEIKKIRPDSVLCLVGDGTLREEIKKKAQQLGILEDVCFAGVQKDVPAFLSAMDTFVFPSLFEGLPFTLVETQANGLSCVIADTITEDIIINKEQVQQLSLTAENALWAKAACQAGSRRRQDVQQLKEELVRAHFDIQEEADRLKMLYLSRRILPSSVGGE